MIFKTSSPEMKQFLQETKALWPEIAIVSAVDVQDGADELTIEAVHAPGTKCPRCWQWKEDIGANPKHTDLCARCAAVLEREGLTVPAEEPAGV